jgi:hypothetical protein
LQGGGTLTGSFTFDADTREYSNINISLSGSSVQTSTVFTFADAAANDDALFAYPTNPPADLTGTEFLQLQFLNALTDAGGTDPILGGNDYLLLCANAGCSTGALSNILSGSVTTSPASPTPEPASVALVLIGLCAACLWTARRSQAART